MDDVISRTFRYASEFYLRRLGLIIVFSIPFIFAFMIPVIVSAPTYLSLGGAFLRTGSIPELSFFDLILTGAAYVVAVFLIADTIVNINLVVRSKRTLTAITQEVFSAMGTYAMRIFYIYTVALLLLFVVQLLTYENPLQTWIFPLFSLLLSFLLFFVPPAVVIDNSDTTMALRRSLYMVLKNPMLFAVWTFASLVSLSIVKLFADLLFSSPYSGYFVLLANSLLLLPFLTVLQTQMYMEKYPLAR